MDSKNKYQNPDYIFEVSWEICNKVGGIYTVLSTKALSIKEKLGRKYILIGPDVWKETSQNPDFVEDHSIMQGWRSMAEAEGLSVRIGRWKIVGEPIVILVDFTTYFSQKDEIFSKYWEKYKLDSIYGQWDYVEPALFGHAAAKVIESYYKYKLSASDKLIAHFHEWMTGTGVLYLNEHIPQAGTVFTTHATVLGRSIAGNMLPLYNKMNTYDPKNAATQFNVTSKFSLEFLSAKFADAFTTVSDITNNECVHFLQKPVDVVTENGFEDDFVPHGHDFIEKRKSARDVLLKVGRGLLNQDISSDAILVINSGRYEFFNKGIDVFIEALGKMNKQEDLEKTIIAYITVPAHQIGVDQELVRRLSQIDYSKPFSQKYLTHGLFDEKNDPCIKAFAKAGLLNRPEDKVKVVFVPAYLNGDDGLFNQSYYDLLIGFDISVFPSYYEPWGYTPLESVAFSIPTITTTLAGFGLWVENNYPQKYNAVEVIDRNDTNSTEVADKIADILVKFSGLKADQLKLVAKEARQISEKALWDHMIKKYWEAYDFAIRKASSRFDQYKHKHILPTHLRNYKSYKLSKPSWKNISIKPNIPDQIRGLSRLASNLWWSWNLEAENLFQSIDENLWYESNRNPKILLERLNYDTLIRLSQDSVFVQRLNVIEKKFSDYMAARHKATGPKIAYFSMEYGLHDSIRIYSGGLGVLAGDYLKQASDSNKNMIAVGLVYRFGYFRQSINHRGEQESLYPSQRSANLPIEPVKDKYNDWLTVQVALPGRLLHAKVWKCSVGRVSLYLMDTDCDENNVKDRAITHNLYGGDWENRFKQELLLGVGGIRLLNALGHEPEIYHCNEGHAAFIGIERLRELIEEKGNSFNEALEVVRSTNLFTTHTPVPAGHDSFEETVLRTYIPHYAERLNLTWEQFMNLGRFVPNDKNQKFSMSVLAARLSQEVNGVSMIHGRVSREMFHSLYPGYYPEEIHIGHVTNSIHLPTWLAQEWYYLFHQKYGDDFFKNQDDAEIWDYVNNIPDESVWTVRRRLKRELFKYIKYKLHADMTKRQESPKLIIKTMESFDDRTLTIGFARRFATYKRAYLLFSNLKRLERIVNRKKRPVQFVFAGKAHPNDKAGQDLIRKIIEVSKRPEFVGKIIFLEDYSMEMAKKLVHGVDVWLNTPTYPMEASGTSGMKAIMNGVLNLSVLDGWWAEGYQPDAGWAIREAELGANPNFQNELDAEILYNLIEDDLIPHFYYRNENGIPENWVRFIKKSMSGIAPTFTMKRMLDEYYTKFYRPMHKRYQSLHANEFEKMHDIVKWKNSIRKVWDSLEVFDVEFPETNEDNLVLGDKFIANVILKSPEIDPEYLRVEVIIGHADGVRVDRILRTFEMNLEKQDGDELTYRFETILDHAGEYRYAVRIYPYRNDLPHRMDFPLLKWI
ncbi:MAG: alpha-glucan family phosphorylase [Bacteroidales bacterium]